MRYAAMTADTPGAVAIVQVTADRAAALDGLLARLFGRDDWPAGRLRLVDFGGFDHGLAGRVDATTAQLMPHGGPRVRRRVAAWLEEHGVAAGGDGCGAWPEAGSDLEARVLELTARAASPAAINRLARQPALWAAAQVNGAEPELDAEIQRVLWRLVDPPAVVVVGRPNAGKSTLLNRLTGRGSALVSDVPGTTRDWVGATVELTPAGGDPLRDAVAVRWLDTPGLRGAAEGAGAVEARAIAAARAVIETADVLIALGADDAGWPAAEALPRAADLRVQNKCEGAAGWRGDVLRISAERDEGVGLLTEAVLERLGVVGVPADALWGLWAEEPRTG